MQNAVQKEKRKGNTKAWLEVEDTEHLNIIPKVEEEMGRVMLEEY